MDELKKYLQQNREELDADVPGEDMWQRIDQQPVVKKQGRTINPAFKFAAAAGVALVLFFGAQLLMKNDKTNESTTIAKKVTFQHDHLDSLQQNNIAEQTGIEKKNDAVIKNTTAENSQANLLDELQNNYGQLVKMELNTIRTTPIFGEAPGYFSEFKTMLKQMDADEILVRNNIKTSGLTAVSLEQLINIYQKKLDLLKSLHTEIEKMNNKVKQTQPTDSLSSYFITI